MREDKLWENRKLSGPKLVKTGGKFKQDKLTLHLIVFCLKYRAHKR